MKGWEKKIKKWVQQATNAQGQLKEAKWCLQKQPELERERDSLNIEAIQMKKKNKRLLRDIVALHNEAETQKQVEIPNTAKVVQNQIRNKLEF